MYIDYYFLFQSNITQELWKINCISFKYVLLLIHYSNRVTQIYIKRFCFPGRGTKTLPAIPGDQSTCWWFKWSRSILHLVSFALAFHEFSWLSTISMTLIPSLTFTYYEWFPWSICNGCGMPAGNAYPSGHLVPSPILGLANAPIVETKFLELAMSLLDFSPRIPLGTFSILLQWCHHPWLSTDS